MTQTTSPPEAPRPRRIWVRVLIFLSVAMNLVVVGIVAGAVLKFSGDHDERDGRVRLSRELGLGPFMMALDEESRAALAAAARARQGDLREGRTAWRGALSETLRLLRSEPFDEAAFLALSQRQAEVASRGRLVGQEILASHLASLTPQERAAFADRLERKIRFVRERRSDMRDGRTRPDGHAPDPR